MKLRIATKILCSTRCGPDGRWVYNRHQHLRALNRWVNYSIRVGRKHEAKNR